MKPNYKEDERAKAVKLILNSQIFDNDKAGKSFMGKPRDFVLLDEMKNIFEPIRNDVLEYFSDNQISWWHGTKPTGHVLSSQIACLNHLFRIRNDARLVLEILKTISHDFVEVLEIKTDKQQAGFFQFEAISDKDHLNEGQPTRGSNCTSIDALMYAKHRDGSKWLIPIEWKYTEYYNNQNKAKEGFENCKGEERKSRYTQLINNSNQLVTENHFCYYFEPFYQLMRQTLWVEQMIKNKYQETLEASNYLHIHVIPSENKTLLEKIYKCSGKNMETTWKSMLKDPNKYRIVSPKELLGNSLNDSKYNKLKSYLMKRYW